MSPISKPQNPNFESGKMVEISSDEVGFRGSWYTGKIIKRASLKNPNRYLIQYDELFEDELGEAPLRETVDGVQLRPLAPREKKRSFRFGERVDAYHNNGWWEGSITEECKDGKFAVFFGGTKEQILFGEDDLRLHREWVDGEWEPSFDEYLDEEKCLMIEKVEENEDNGVKEAAITKELSLYKAETEKTLGFSIGMEVEIRTDEEGLRGAWFAATIVEALEDNKYLVEYKSLRTEDDSDFLREEIDASHIRPCPPETIMVDSFRVMDEVDALYNDGWWVGIITKVLTDSKYMVFFGDTNELMMFRHSKLRLHQDWIAGQWVVPSSV